VHVVTPLVNPARYHKIPRIAAGSSQVQDEQSLVRKAQEGSQQAFSELYEAYFDKIYRYIALKIGDRTEAEDMTQQVFLKALKSLPSFKWKDVPFSAWLYRIAHNEIVDHLRRSSRRPTTELTEDITPDDPCENPQHRIEVRYDMENLLTAARRLTKAQQEVIALRFSSDLPIAEVARIMGRSEGAVKALQHSAVSALRKLMAY
jgi:RNA polymerase sigma-70 factor (ECF subfamily)